MKKEKKFLGRVEECGYGDGPAYWEGYTIGDKLFVQIEDLLGKYKGKNIELIIKVID